MHLMCLKCKKKMVCEKRLKNVFENVFSILKTLIAPLVVFMCLFSVAGHKHLHAFFLRHIKVFINCHRNAFYLKRLLFSV